MNDIKIKPVNIEFLSFDSEKFKSWKRTFTPLKVASDDIFSRFKALKLSLEFNFFKRRGYDFKIVLLRISP
jgi:hypothetical protein